MCACINARSIVSADKILCCINTLVIISYNSRAQELCESRGGSPGLPVPNSPYGLCGRKATVEEEQSVLHSASTYFGTDALVAISRDSTFDQEQQQTVL